jgi:uncharacterized protein
VSPLRPEPISAIAPLRISRPSTRQTWRDLTFLHWPYEPALIRPLVPAPLELDLYDGLAWVGLVPFVITDLTHPSAPAIPWLSNFAETNLRTYVIDRTGKRGVWFFSLDAARLAAVIGARTVYALPYFWNRMSVICEAPSVRYKSVRLHGPKASAEIAVRTGETIASPSELDLFLTARFRLYAARGSQILTAGIDHAPWPLRRATVCLLKQNLLRAAGLPDPSQEPLALFSGRLDVLVGPPKRL